MGTDVVNQIACIDEAPQQRDFVARMRAELLDLSGREVRGERRHRPEDAMHLDGARASRSKSILPMLEPAPHASILIVTPVERPPIGTITASLAGAKPAARPCGALTLQVPGDSVLLSLSMIFSENRYPLFGIML